MGKWHPVQILITYFSQWKLSKHDIAIILVNFFFFIGTMIYYKLNKSPQNTLEAIERITIVKRGQIFGGSGGEQSYDDAAIAELTYNDTITAIYGSKRQLHGKWTLQTLNFNYSNGQQGQKYGGYNVPSPESQQKRFILNKEEYINKIVVYEDDQPYHIVMGIEFITNHNRSCLFGESNRKPKTESYKDYFLAYIEGKFHGYIDRLVFTWYRYVPKNSLIYE